LGAYLLSLYVDTFSEDVSKLMIDSKSRKANDRLARNIISISGQIVFFNALF
jgi:hypothetical protein